MQAAGRLAARASTRSGVLARLSGALRQELVELRRRLEQFQMADDSKQSGSRNCDRAMECNRA